MEIRDWIALIALVGGAIFGAAYKLPKLFVKEFDFLLLVLLVSGAATGGFLFGRSSGALDAYRCGAEKVVPQSTCTEAVLTATSNSLNLIWIFVGLMSALTVARVIAKHQIEEEEEK